MENGNNQSYNMFHFFVSILVNMISYKQGCYD